MLPVEAQVIGEVITSSPSPIPAARNARWRPAVADVTATACAAPTAWAKARSNSSTRGPLVIQPERRQAVTAAISASPMLGRESGKNSARTVSPRPPRRASGSYATLTAKSRARSGEAGMLTQYYQGSNLHALLRTLHTATRGDRRPRPAMMDWRELEASCHLVGWRVVLDRRVLPWVHAQRVALLERVG